MKMEIKGMLRIVRDGSVKLTLPAILMTKKADGTLWYQGMPILGVGEDKKAEMSKLVKAKKWDEIPAGYYVKLGDNDNGLWVGDDEAWGKHPAKIAEEAKKIKEEEARKNTIRIYLSSRGWGDYSSLEWVGDATKSSQSILVECKKLLSEGVDVDKTLTDQELLKLIEDAKAKWATPTGKKQVESHGTGYCYSCEGYCYGDCGDYQPEMTHKIMSNHARKEEHLDE